jgi:5-methylcytosine-specific restriction endonuclease McrA
MSPIRESERARYPKNWREISKAVRQRNNGCCEWCDVPNGETIQRDADGDWHLYPALPDAEPVRVVLTVAHLDHNPENCDPSNLRSLCQRCHNRYDAKHRAAGRKARQHAATHDGQAVLL